MSIGLERSTKYTVAIQQLLKMPFWCGRYTVQANLPRQVWGQNIKPPRIMMGQKSQYAFLPLMGAVALAEHLGLNALLAVKKWKSSGRIPRILARLGAEL
jgi:hypothetical protein